MTRDLHVGPPMRKREMRAENDILATETCQCGKPVK
jgi:hypothetical protein